MHSRSNIATLYCSIECVVCKCPKVKLQFARQAFRFSAAKIYNELPMQIRAEKDSKIFRDMLDSNFI